MSMIAVMAIWAALLRIALPHSYSAHPPGTERVQAMEQISAKSGDWVDEAKDLAGQAKVRASDLAVEGKAKTSDAIASLGQIVADNAGTIDEKLGAKYGDYARTAARTMQETAAKIEAKDINELGDDAKQFVRKSPAMALGIAAVFGFLVSRLFKGGSNEA
jgi:ElaB/YqjD/DUF883 family membrane-anchored ribosome-binding protein